VVTAEASSWVHRGRPVPGGGRGSVVWSSVVVAVVVVSEASGRRIAPQRST
jgi:hypothetical protein